MAKRASVEEYIGKKAGRLTCLGIHEHRHGRTYFLCKCDCGKEVVIRRDNFIAGMKEGSNSGTKSCGCLSSECGKIQGAANLKRWHEERAKAEAKAEAKEDK